MSNALIAFLLNEWLWSITWAFYHPLMAMVIMFFLIFFWEGICFIPAVLLSLGATLFSALIFIGGVGIVVWRATAHVPQELLSADPTNVWWACIYLGLIYAALQTLFFALVSRWYSLHVGRLAIVALASNLATAAIVYKLLPLF